MLSKPSEIGSQDKLILSFTVSTQQLLKFLLTSALMVQGSRDFLPGNKLKENNLYFKKKQKTKPRSTYVGI